MSSTSIVVKCLTDAKATNTQHGQITIGTLILQDCMVGLLFAFMPVLANNRSADPGDSFEVIRLITRYNFNVFCTSSDAGNHVNVKGLSCGLA